MSWLQRYRIRHYLVNSLWILPVLSIVLALAVVPLLHQLDQSLDWESGINPETVRTVLEMMASSMFNFIVFVCSALLIAVQLASAQLTPRIIALVFRDPVTKLSLTIFVFTFTFSQAILVRINTEVPTLSARLAAYSCIACLGVFLFLIDHVGKWLRPSGTLRAVALIGRDVIENVYPRRLSEFRKTTTDSAAILDGKSAQKVASRRNGVILAFDIQGLVSMAQRADCIIEMVPHVGDFLAAGDPLFRVYPGGTSLAEHDLRQSVAVGQERTMEQDPTLAFRILVDIAAKGLSPAINDPTTAVLAIDQIHHLLRNVGGRHLDDERVRDAAGRTRLVFRTPAWEDFVQLAVTEIRHFGGASIQITRRLRAMLENLIETLPATRAPVLQHELSLLQRSAQRFFAEPEDRAMAEVGDFQGVGSSSNAKEPSEAKPK
ncbi:MAG: DUF2254 domain-containing protein [Thermoguttaceae bacterium]